jgi:hypothetical protein
MSHRKSTRRSVSYCPPAALLLAITTFGAATAAIAQDVSDLQKAKSPLVLDSQGSFVVGGQNVAKNAVDVGGAAPGHITIKQLYVEYMIPSGANKVPVVMIHGGGLSGKSFQTTPDGRMGWNEYFVRQGHPVYNVDQVARAVFVRPNCLQSSSRRSPFPKRTARHHSNNRRGSLAEFPFRSVIRCCLARRAVSRRARG